MHGWSSAPVRDIHKMALDLRSLCVCMSLLCHVYTSEPAIPQVAMDERCGRRLVVEEPFVLALTEKLYYQPSMNCDLILQARPGHRFMLRFIHLQIHTNSMMKQCEDFVVINYGQKVPYASGIPVICRTKPAESLVTSNTTAVIHFYSNAYGEDRGFRLLVTPFHTGRCYSGEFRCKNGRCIDSSMHCNTYNNCGDNSDYCDISDVNYSSTIYMAAAIILCLILLVVIVSMCCCCATSSRKRRRRRRSRLARRSRQQAQERCEAYDNPVGVFTLNDLPPYVDIPSYPPPAYSTLPRRHTQSESSGTPVEATSGGTVVPVDEGTYTSLDIPAEETSTHVNTPEEGTGVRASIPSAQGDKPEDGTPGHTSDRDIPKCTPGYT
ncbi:uncharacterized protein [Haliotis asinina]|uniref:uncharacterized protein n=1 Tax=Haliotis asinina TaxID=109174 RepID=UPI00353207C0